MMVVLLLCGLSHYAATNLILYSFDIRIFGELLVGKEVERAGSGIIAAFAYES